ncbi:hypothetical protein [Paenibacillus mucilaginosus]|uniref:Uncharacterized protein n=2 Tax=Paenibacillus mucilaginosus TaxID=61624 RepID=I0BQX6_9BACL|nr:hypothetical protein [Paenibacillus mucilaginosus]AEI44680.1 hypothetical protein KNP414_06156 [Paenibacillus mucilaginosus KNP414]AFH64773.1 hypothetical protein B2K_29425 [Paenibacillus mucilaginosus K02]MCG7215609.1 hypothetical protein [Paenibacillus mucilaginosus]WDM26237.1 hypothetical protein KCX80_27930 [Paenibacillus mucilaginosus]
MFLIDLFPLMIGLYCVTLALWELREGHDRKRFVTLMFSGLVLVFVVPRLLGVGAGLFLTGFH